MNCKKNDMAIIIKSDYGNVGVSVRCIEFIGKIDDFKHNDYWEVEASHPISAKTRVGGKPGAGVLINIPDSYLMPIRPEQDDELMLEMIPMLLTDVRDA